MTLPPPLPQLPPHLDELLDKPWSAQASRKLDLWLWYLSEEFEAVGGMV
jgi:hypothetical protein